MNGQRVLRELQEYIVLPRPCNTVLPEARPTSDKDREEIPVIIGEPLSPKTSPPSGPIHWTRPMTLKLIYEFGERKLHVGESVKSQKKIFELIAELLYKEFNIKLAWLQVSNKWNSLERTYIEVIDNNSTTGRRRRDFEFEEQMAAILGKRRNVTPGILLSENAELVTPPAKKKRETFSENDDPEQREMAAVVENAPGTTPKLPRKPKTTRVRAFEQRRRDKLAEAEDRKNRWEEKYLLEKRLVEAAEQKNILAKEKNDLLRALLDKLGKH